jgi:predicted dehydrogenase
MNNFRIGIIGAGSIVEGNHLPALRSLPQTDIAWIYDKNASRAALLSKMYGIPALDGQPAEQAMEQVDTCLLATPYGTRQPYIDLCRRLGKAIVIEKPFAFSKQQHLAHCEGFAEWRIAINYQRRYYRSVAVIREIIASGIFGRLQSARFVQGHFTLKGGSGYLSSVELAGGGIIAESASHILDILLSVTGAKDIQLQQLRSLHVKGLEYDAVFDSEIITADNKLPVHCEISTLRNLANGLYLQFGNALISCDLSPDGKIFVRDQPGGPAHQTCFSLSGLSSPEELSRQATAVNEAFLVFWQQFLEGMRQQKANGTSAYSSLLTSAWLGEIYKKINLS